MGARLRVQLLRLFVWHDQRDDWRIAASTPSMSFNFLVCPGIPSIFKHSLLACERAKRPCGWACRQCKGAPCVLCKLASCKESRSYGLCCSCSDAQSSFGTNFSLGAALLTSRSQILLVRTHSFAWGMLVQRLQRGLPREPTWQRSHLSAGGNCCKTAGQHALVLQNARVTC